MCEICSTLTIKTPNDGEQISHVVLFSLLTLNKFMPAGFAKCVQFAAIGGVL